MPGGSHLCPILTRDGTEVYYEVHGDGTTVSVLQRHRARPPSLEVSSGAGVFPRSQSDSVRLPRHRQIEQERFRNIRSKCSPTTPRRYLQHLNVEQAIVCGHSMGGVVAQLLTLDYPRLVKKLILASSGAAHPGAHGIPLAMCRDMVQARLRRLYPRAHHPHRLDQRVRRQESGADREVFAGPYVGYRIDRPLPLFRFGAPGA